VPVTRSAERLPGNKIPLGVIPMTTEIITGLFDIYDEAAQSVREIEAIGVPRDDLSVVANNIDNRYVTTEGSNAGPDAAAGAGVGALLGGGAGVLAGLGLLAIPGVGPVVAAGWLVTAAVGAVAGAGAGGITGGVVGSLTGGGVSKEHAHIYAEGIRRGGTLVTARVEPNQAVAVGEIMHRNHAVDPASRGKTYRDTGWNSFDETASPYTATELERERQRTRDLTPVL
jgi:hypothetical protein